MKTGTKTGVVAARAMLADGSGVLRRRVALAGAVAVTLGVAAAHGAPTTWTGATNNDFNLAANWDTNAAPTSADDVFLTAPAATNLSMNLTAPITIRTLTFTADAPGSVTLGTDTTNRLTFANLTGNNIDVLGGSHAIVAADNVSPNIDIKTGTNATRFQVNVAAGAQLDLNGRLSQGNSGQQFRKTGAGTLILSASNGGGTGWNVSGGTGGIFVDEGTLVNANNGASGNSGNRLTVAGGAVLELRANWGSTGNPSTLQNGATLRSVGGDRSWGNGAGTLVLDGGTATIDVVDNQFTLSQDMSGAGGFVKTGAGLLIIGDGTNGVNSYTGTTAVAAGTLQLASGASIASSRLVDVRSGATLDAAPAGGLTVAANQTLGGAGTVVGNVTVPAGATVAPGLAGTVGTLNFANDLTLSGGALSLDLSSPAVTGETVAVAGTLNVSAPSVVNINRVTGTLAAGTYTIATYGTLGTDAATTMANLLLPQVRQGLTLVDPSTTPGTLQITAGAGSAASLVWTGTANGQWDRTVGNFTNGGSPDKFFDWDDVSFTGGGPANVTLTGVLVPDDVTVSGGTSYTFGGTGTLSAVRTLTKSGASTLTINNSGFNSINDVSVNGGTLVLANPGGVSYSIGNVAVAGGATMRVVGSTPNAINNTTVAAGGVVELGDGGTTGSIGNVNNAGTVRYNVPGGTTLSTGVISGTGGVTKLGNGTVTVPSTAVHTYTGNTDVTAGTIVVTTSNSLGAPGSGTVTVSNNAALDLSGGTAANLIDFGQKQFVVGGNGPGGSGVIVNDGTVAQQNALERVRLTADSRFGGSQRFDMRAAQVGGANVVQLDLAGHTLTKIGTGQFTIVAGDVTDGNIVAQEGVFAMETTTSVPDFGTGKTITYNGATAQFFANTTDANSQSFIRRPIVIAQDTTLGNASNTAATVGSPITLNGNITTRALNANGTGTLTLQGNISGPGGIFKENNGTGNNALVLAGTNTYTGQTFITGGTVTFAGTNTGSSLLNVQDGTVAQTTVGAVHTLRFGSVNLNGSGRLDIGDDRLVIGGALDVGTMRSYLVRGYAGGAWNGNGLMSAAAQGSAIRGIGWAVAGDAGLTQWGSVVGLAATDIVARMTYVGDLDLDGAVEGDDFALIDKQVAMNGLGSAGDWIDGDVNYDGVVNALDYIAMDTAFGQQSGVLSAAFLAEREARFGSAYVSQLVAAVPEPSVGLLVAGGALLAGGRRRRAV